MDSWTRVPTVIPGVGLVPEFVKDLEAVEDEASGWDGLAGNTNPSDPIEVEVIARSFVECRAFAALGQSCRWTLAAG